MYVVINQSFPLPISSFLSLYLLFPPPYTRTSNQLAYMLACMVCMYACVHIGVHCWLGSRCEVVTRMETPRMGLSDGNTSYGSVTCYIASQLRPGRPLEQVSHLSGCTRVCIYACTCMSTFVYVCVGLDWGNYMDDEGLKRWKKRTEDRYSETDVCT